MVFPRFPILFHHFPMVHRASAATPCHGAALRALLVPGVRRPGCVSGLLATQRTRRRRWLRALFYGKEKMNVMVTCNGISWRDHMILYDTLRYDKVFLVYILVGGLVAICYFPIYWVSNHPNWLSYFSEGWPNHQPDGNMLGIIYIYIFRYTWFHSIWM